MREEREAKADGAKLVRNSGRGFHKGDAILGECLIDYKDNAKSFTLELKNWKKHSKDAWEEGHYFPVIGVTLGGEHKVAIIDWEWFKQLIGEE